MPPRRSPFVRAPTEPLDASTLEWKFRRQLIEPPNTTSDSRPRARLVRANDIVVEHAHNFASDVPEPSDANDESVVDDVEVGLKPHSLKQYLQESWFPAFEVGPQAKQNFVWPHYPELQVAPGTRKLRVISRIMPYRIHGAASQYIEQQKDKQLEPTGNSGDLTLPSIDFMKYDDKDVNPYTQNVNFVTDITTLLMIFAFRTVAKCLDLLHDIPEGEDGDALRQFLQFKRSICPVGGNIFDVVSLPSPHPGHTSMIILVVPPWVLNNMDFISFIDTGAVTPGSLDGIPTAKPASASATMWALLWDMCSKQKCQYFAVTTYEFWAFGNFSSNMQHAYISDLFRAPVHLHNAEVQQDMLPSPTVCETLLFWMAACVGAGGILWKPCDDKTTSWSLSS